MMTLRPRRKLLAPATLITSGALAATLVVGCGKEMVGDPACSPEECSGSPDGGSQVVGSPAVPLDGAVGKVSAPIDGGDAAIQADAGVIAQPLDGGDGG